MGFQPETLVRFKEESPFMKRKYGLFLFALVTLGTTLSLASVGLSEAAAESSKDSLQSEEIIPFYSKIENLAKRKCIVEMTPKELLISYKQLLSKLDWAQNQNELQVILDKVGNNVVTFFQSLVSTAASEHMILERFINERIKGTFVNKAKSNSFNYKYIILPRSEENGKLLNEYRTDSRNRPVNRNAELNSFMASTGYFGFCLYLHPKHQPGSTFRYLGREKGKNGIYIIAFAQKPEFHDYLAKVTEITTKDSTLFLVQGFVWLDPNTFQITRIRTSLLIPDSNNETSLIEQITDAEYDQVVFNIGKNQKKQLWLPREVYICWEFPHRLYRNRYRYTNYHLFSVSTHINFPNSFR
jgi:hypothetical protein